MDNSTQQPNSIPPKITKITIEDMSGLVTRGMILANKENELKFLQNENKANWRELTKKYGLDPELTYTIDQANNLLIWRDKKEESK